MGDGVGYRYPHDRDDAVLSQQYLPDEATGAVAFRPKRLGEEADLADRLDIIDEVLGKPDRG
jgi:putative ATPase